MYNECLKQLNKTQDELITLRKKAGGSNLTTQNRQTMTSGNMMAHKLSKSTSTSNANSGDSTAIYSQLVSCDDDGSYFELDNLNQSNNNNNNYRPNNNNQMYSSWMSANTSSFAAELFTSLARDYRAKNSNL